ncbi:MULTISPECIES: J domain-containing protein [unclassified Janthinobacterium]|uniref:J domain-containing protein n=1 Tax=unclassified Janthinobacterium TaxID=2610881 RepID=UPI001622A6EF|nr:MULTISPECIES: J domain-containing protein [unclassified Janthinobacterium]MBB5607523.1 hypothetical protein [Janthinobacterium sp. S3T4]MBB5612544.1 hypothetical protein [Janthinobacterium sp. S3M3]
MHQGQRSLWDILGTEPTGDERAIKRAYAKQLKTTRPDDDPAAFQQLREAYEYALRHAPMLNAQLLEHERGPQEETVTLETPAAPAELWGVVAQETAPAKISSPVRELWGTVVIDPAEQAASLWHELMTLAQHRNAEAMLPAFMAREELLNLDVHEEFELCALRYCASEGYDLSLRLALFETMGWNEDHAYLARRQPELMHNAMARYRADRSYALFLDNRDQHRGIACLLSQQPPSAYGRQLFDQAFTEEVKGLLQTVRWHHPEMLVYKLDGDLFKRWEHAVHSKRYFKDTALTSIGLGCAFNFMLATIAGVARLPLLQPQWTNLLFCQVVAFALMTMHAFGWPAPLFSLWQLLKKRSINYLPVLHERPELLYLAWIVPFLVVGALYFIPSPDKELRIATASGLCFATLIAGASSRSLLTGRQLLYMVGLTLLSTLIIMGNGTSAMNGNEGMMLSFCALMLTIRAKEGLYAACGGTVAMLPWLRMAWIIGCIGLILELYLHLLPAALLGAALFAWSCIGMLLASCDFSLKAGWPVILAPAIASFILLHQQDAAQIQPLLRLAVVLALAVLYFTVRSIYQSYRMSLSQPGLS